MKIKTSEATPLQLNWLVAKCEEVEFTYENHPQHELLLYNYSTDWAQGGPLIEREKIFIGWLSRQDLGIEPEHYCVAHIDGIYVRYGATPLIAAMRCYVASKLGDEVEIPEELK
jgi:hypothetical protein